MSGLKKTPETLPNFGTFIITTYLLALLITLSGCNLPLTIEYGISIKSDSDFEKYSSSGSGTTEDPFIIDNFQTERKFQGISIQDTTSHFIIAGCVIKQCQTGISLANIAPNSATIVNCTIFDGWYPEVGPFSGISILSSDRVKISNITISDTGINGIYLNSSSQSLINNNTISGTSVGIALESSSSTKIQGNSFINTDKGIHSWTLSVSNNISCNFFKNTYLNCIALIDSEGAIIFNNSFHLVTEETWFSAAIELVACSNFKIFNNTVNNCIKGIVIEGSSNGQIYYNKFVNNAKTAISISSIAESNVIFLNTFMNNNIIGISQAEDNGTDNVWFESLLEQGNYWSDWNGTNGYLIGGTANSYDFYPLTIPPV